MTEPDTSQHRRKSRRLQELSVGNTGDGDISDDVIDTTEEAIAALLEGIDDHDNITHITTHITANQKSRLKKRKTNLRQLPAQQFSEAMLQNIHWLNIKSDERRHGININKSETIIDYLTYKGDKKEEFEDGTLIKTTILPYMWQYGDKTRTAWDSKDVGKIKNQQTTASRMKLVMEANTKNLMDKESNGVYYGNYTKRPSAFDLLFETQDIERIENELLPAFIPGSSYNLDERGVGCAVSPNIYWNGKMIPTSCLQYLKLNGVDNKFLFVQKEKNGDQRQLCIDGNGLRNKLIAYYRVGDWMSREEIMRVIELCKDYKHAIPAFILITITYRHYKLRNEFKSGKTPAIKQEDEKKEAMVLACDFAKALREAVSDNIDLFGPKDLVRTGWITWSPMAVKFNKMYNENELNKRRVELRKVTKENHDEVLYFHYALIIFITQHAADEVVEEAFRNVTDGMTTLDSFLKPLRRIDMCEYFEILMEIFRPVSGMYATRALTILNLIVVSAVLYRGKVPREASELMGFWQVSEKKSNIILNTQEGIFVGVGVDKHVICILIACLDCIIQGYKRDSSESGRKTDSYFIGSIMPEDPGAFFNEIVGECAQAYSNRHVLGDDRWSGIWLPILREVSKRDERFKRIICKWLSVEN
eukprot:scaffold9111_cov90-Skeletonema_dohrnii-CCMP3373.AAC.1